MFSPVPKCKQPESFSSLPRVCTGVSSQCSYCMNLTICEVVLISHWHVRERRKTAVLAFCILLLYFFSLWTCLYSKILTFIGNLCDSIIKWCKSMQTQIGCQDLCQWHIRFSLFYGFKNHYCMIQFRKHLNKYLVSNTVLEASGIPKEVENGSYNQGTSNFIGVYEMCMIKCQNTWWTY